MTPATVPASPDLDDASVDVPVPENVADATPDAGVDVPGTDYEAGVEDAPDNDGDASADASATAPHAEQQPPGARNVPQTYETMRPGEAFAYFIAPRADGSAHWTPAIITHQPNGTTSTTIDLVVLTRHGYGYETSVLHFDAAVQAEGGGSDGWDRMARHGRCSWLAASDGRCLQMPGVQAVTWRFRDLDSIVDEEE